MVERVVTPQLVWEVQVCDNELGAFSTLKCFTDEVDATEYFDKYRVRLVQEALISYKEK